MIKRQTLQGKFFYNPIFAKRLSDYASSVAIVSLGICSNYLFIERMMYIEAYALTMMLSLDTKISKSIRICCIGMIFIFFWVFLNNDITTFIVNYI